MSTISLTIGGVDVSEYVEADSYSCKRRDVIPHTFTNYDGSTVAERSGYKYEISCSFDSIPESVAASLAAALDNDTISVTFTDLLSATTGRTTTASFERPDEIGGKINAETDDGELWSIELSLTSALIAVSGSL